MAAKISGPGGGSRFVTQQNSDINVTPFVDVMLVLLIIFMVSIPAATVSIRLDLPPANASTVMPDRPPTFVSIQESGAIFVDRTETSLVNLGGDLTRALGVARPQEERIFVRADPNVRYEPFMSVLNALQEGGFYQIALIGEDFTNR